MNPKISVIVPVYKAEKYLHRCVDSILAQTFTDFEVLLIDDGSPDRSGEICDEYAEKDTRITVLHQINKGVSSARNNGLDNANGEYILFLDSDDWLDFDCIGFCINEMQRTDADIMQFPTIRVTSEEYNKNTVATIKNGILHNTKEYIAQNIYFVCIGGTVIKKEIIDAGKIRFRDDIKLAEDQIFIMDCLKRSTTVYRTNYPFYKYFVNDSGATSNSKSQPMIDSVKALVEYKDVNPQYTTTIDYTLLYFLWNIIKNNDTPDEELKIMVKGSRLNKSMKFSIWEKIFITLSKYTPLLSIYYVRKYNKLRR